MQAITPAELQQVKQAHTDAMRAFVREAIAFVAVIKVAKSGLSAKAEVVGVRADGARWSIHPLEGGHVWALRELGTCRQHLLTERIARAYGVSYAQISEKITVLYV